MPKSRPLLDRFAEKVATDDNGCLIWLGAVNQKHDHPYQYGAIHYEGRPVLVHRVSWFLIHGEWPAPGMELDHLCRVHLCCHPDHLELVTHAENLRRGNKKIERPDPSKCASGKHDWVDENILSGKQCRACHREAQHRRRQLYGR